MRMIEELFYGNIDINGRTISPDSRERILSKLSCKNDEKFRSVLPDELIEKFNEYSENENLLSSQFECEIFIYGFSLGMRLAFESFAEDYRKDSSTPRYSAQNDSN